MEIDEAAKILWDYNKLGHSLEKADLILVLGTHDTRVADRGAELFKEGWAPLLMFSGGFGRLTGDWKKPEAEMLADIAMERGVPADKIIIENKSTNTGENIDFSMALLKEKGLFPQKLILIQKPYMERRAYAAFKKRFPDVDVHMSSPQVSYEEYPNAEISKDEMINIMVGDTQRNKLYGERGWQIPQEVPDNVWQAWEFLVAAGYDKYLVKD